MERSSLIGHIDQRLTALIPDEGRLYDAARYSLLAPGKRIRPLLTLTLAQQLGVPLEQALTPACALEMIHAYSLIHDDLPCMDDDDMRRGKPTLHRAYDEATAVLAGDFLLTHAFAVLAGAPELSPQTRLALIDTLSARGHGMILGQIHDIHGGASRAEMHARKTGDLFVAAALFAGHLAEANAQTLKQLETFGHIFGLLFQLVDDIDDKEQTLTQAHAQITDLEKRLSASIAALPGNGQPLEDFKKKLLSAVMTADETAV